MAAPFPSLKFAKFITREDQQKSTLNKVHRDYEYNKIIAEYICIANGY
jgi:hypothetical protein